MAPDSSTTLRSSIQPHPSSICSCTMTPKLVVIYAVDTTPHHLATSTPSPLLELLGAHHPQHLSPEQQFLPRRRLHGGYDAQGTATAQSRLNFGLSSGRGLGVDRGTSTSPPGRVTASSDVADAGPNTPTKVSSGPHPMPPNLRVLRIRQATIRNPR